MDELVIPSKRPLLAKRVLDVLTSGPKLSIMKLLLEKGSLSAKEIANELNLKLSTVLNHLNDLVKAGLVHISIEKQDSRTIKKYHLISKKIRIELDLETFLHLEKYAREEELKEFEDLVYRYIELKCSQSKLPLSITVKDVVSVLGIDMNTAIGVVDFINSYTDRVIEYIANKVFEYLKKNRESSIDTISRDLRIHEYWIALAIQNLVSRGLVRLDEKNHVVLSVEKTG